MIRTLIAGASALALGACATTTTVDESEMVRYVPAEAAAVPDNAAWTDFMNGYIEATFRANPGFAVGQGRHEYDGQIRNLSPAAIAAENARLKLAIATAKAFPDAILSPTQRFERDYLIAQATGDLFWISPEGADQFSNNPASYLGALDPSTYITVPYADKDVRLKAYIAHLKNIPTAVAQMRANLKTPMAESFVEYGVNAFGGFAAYFPGDGVAAWEGVGSAEDQAALMAATRDATKAIADASSWFKSLRKTATTDFALGPDKFAKMLKDTEMVDVSLDELKAIGMKDLKRNQALLVEACGRYAPGATIQACVSKMNANKMPQGPVQGARDQLAGLRQFIIDKDLVSIPGTELAKVEESPPYNRQNLAYINIPGPYEKGLPSTYYISPPDPSWSKEVRDGFVPGEANLLAISIHEVWPGHFLNFLHSNRSPFLFGRVFVGYAFAEGWAHYTEELMRAEGVEGGTDEVMIGQLSNALLRNCRYVSAIGLHSRTMTQDESFDLFKNECYQDDGNAMQQAARGTRDPAYLNYTLGKLMILKLRDDWTATRGGRAAYKEFHDTFLSYGGPPIPLVRQQMMGEADAKAVFRD